MSLNEFSVQEIESLVDEKKRTLIYMYIGYAYKLKIGLSHRLDKFESTALPASNRKIAY